MAGVGDKVKKKKQAGARDWSASGSFINKPAKGWLHPDEQLAPQAGICYGVRYVGSMEVKQSMKTLDFDTRTAVTKESISRVCEMAGLKSAPKKNKRSGKVSKLLGEQPNLLFAGSNVNLTITTDCLTIMIMESGEVIANHQMPGISFASGGDPDTMDFVAYVAKDEMFGRCCHVLECGGGLAQDVITTIGQAFEIRFKQYLANKPGTLNVPDRMTAPLNSDAWGEDRDYYNDRPGAAPPPLPEARPQEYSVPKSNMPVLENSITYDNNKDVSELREYDNSAPVPRSPLANGLDVFHDAVYDNKSECVVSEVSPMSSENVPQPDSKHTEAKSVMKVSNESLSRHTAGDRNSNGSLDPFDMTPFCNTMQTETLNNNIKSPYNEAWFHGKLTRKQVEEMLLADGDFLVRESSNQVGQFVLSGRHNNRIKHLLLVDPEGVVRTKDKEFDSISHLIDFHMKDNIPITSSDSELMLRNPIKRQH